MSAGRIAALAALALILTGAASAEPFLPAFAVPATVSANRQEPLTSLRLPVGPFADGAMRTELVEGPLDQTAWRLQAPGQTTLQLLSPLREQLAREGWRTLFECETEACGGFDFRYGMDVMPEPDMHVDLRDFRYLAAERGTGAARQVVEILVSRSAVSGFAQVTQVGGRLPAPPTADPAPGDPPPAPPAEAGDPESLPARLLSGEAVALDDLVFASGSAELADGDSGSLAALAGVLRADPAARVILVGHTDASGPLDANMALSRRRAEAVRVRLVEGFGIDPARIEAEGVGYLAPRADNRTEEGRRLNRRVEAMLTSTP